MPQSALTWGMGECLCEACAMCHLVVGWGWTELILMGLLSPKLQTRLSGLAWWLMVHFPWSAAMLGLYEGNTDLLWKPSVCGESLFFNKITTADTLLSNKMITAESKRKHRKTAETSNLINWKGYEGFDEWRGRVVPWRHVTWNGIGWMLFGVVQKVFLVCILIFFFFSVDFGFFGFLLEVKSYFWAGEVALTLLFFPLL